MIEEEIKIFIDEYYKLKNIQNSIKEIDKDFFFDLVDKLLYLYNKEKEKNERIKNYAYQEIAHHTEDIKDYIDDDKIGNKYIIGELRETREHWRDIMKISDSEPDSKLYMNWKKIGEYE